MAGKTGSRKRKGSRGACSYCGRVHKKGKRRGDSCRRGAAGAAGSKPKP